MGVLARFPARSTPDAFGLLRAWQDYLEVRGFAETTRRQYRRYLLMFLADILIDPREVSEEDVVSYLAQHLAAKTPMRGMLLRALRSFYGYLAERGLSSNPVKALRAQRGPFYLRLRCCIMVQVRVQVTAEQAARLLVGALGLAWGEVSVHVRGEDIELIRKTETLKPDKLREYIVEIDWPPN